MAKEFFKHGIEYGIDVAVMFRCAVFHIVSSTTRSPGL